MCSRSSEVPVDDDDRDENTDSVHDEGEQEILGNEREDERGGWENLWDKQEEHNKREENTDTKGYFFSCFCW